MPNSNDLRIIQRDIVKWADDTIGKNRLIEKTLWKLVMEEIPELAQAYNATGELDAGEVGDVLILVLDLCHLAKIDPAEAVWVKMDVNKSRKWAAGHSGVMSHVDT